VSTSTQAKTQAGPFRSWEFRFRTRAPKAHPRHVEFTENPTDVEQALAQAKTQAGPLRSWQFRFRALAITANPRHLILTRNPTDVALTLARPTHGIDPAAQVTTRSPRRRDRAHLKSPCHCVSPPGTTTRNKHYLPPHAPQAGVTQETPPTGLPPNSPASPSCLATQGCQPEEKELRAKATNPANARMRHEREPRKNKKSYGPRQPIPAQDCT
jgi:hypothetical protein